MITIVIPTVAGREEHFERCITAYKERTVSKYRIVVIRDAPHVGRAWNEGAELAVGEWLHFTNDDCEPHPNWDVAAINAWKDGYCPKALMYESDGSRWYNDTDNCHIPFCSAEAWPQVGPHLDAHFYTDDWFGERCAAIGYPVRLTPGYDFTHHWAMVRRGAGMSEHDRLINDLAVYEKAKADAGL